MTREKVSFKDVFEAAKMARDQRILEVARADFERDEQLEREATLSELVKNQGELLVEHMMRMNRLGVKRLLGLHAAKLSKVKHPKLSSGVNIFLTTPLLMATAVEHDRGMEFRHGWQFETRAVEDNKRAGTIRKSMVPLAVKIEGHMQELTGNIDELTEIYNIPIRGLGMRSSGFTSPVESKRPLRDDPDDPELYTMYALLNMARRELGDKSVQ